jgi:hypothetical protein
MLARTRLHGELRLAQIGSLRILGDNLDGYDQTALLTGTE